VPSEKKGVKSALDIALERFGPLPETQTLTPEQKQKIADLDRNYQAQIAEKEVVYDERIRNAQRSGDFPRAEEIRQEKARELRKLKERLEQDKEKARKGKGE
jgi:hypothetical protein